MDYATMGTQTVSTQARWWTQDCGEDFGKRCANLHRRAGTRASPDNEGKKDWPALKHKKLLNLATML